MKSKAYIWINFSDASLTCTATYSCNVLHHCQIAMHVCINITIILINGTLLQEVSSTKYLGLLIDNELKWIDHLVYIKIIISRGIGIIARVKPFVNKSAFL